MTTPVPAPSFVFTADIAIGLLGMLAPMQGSRARGDATITFTGGPFSLPARTTLYPRLAGTDQIDFKRPFWTVGAAPAADGDRSDILTTSPETIEIVSVLGGDAQNLPDGTQLVFEDGQASGIDNFVTVDGDLTGGALFTGARALKSIVWFQRSVPGSSIPDDVNRAGAEQVPCAVLTWVDSPIEAFKSASTAQVADTWVLTILTKTSVHHHVRERQALAICDLVTQLIFNRGTVDGIARVSGTKGIKVIGRRPVTAGTGLAAYEIRFQTFNAIEAVVKDQPELVFDPSMLASDWLTTTLRSPTLDSETDAHPGTIDVVREGIYPQP